MQASTGSRRWALVVALVVAALAAAQLFLGSDVGLANNGDGARLMCKAGLWPLQGNGTLSVQWDYAPASTLPVCAPSTIFRMSTSSSWLLRPVVWLYQHVAGTDHFDLRALGLAEALLLGGAVGALHLAWPGPRRARLLVAAAVAVAALDIAYVVYFNSPLSDASALVALVALLAGAVRLSTVDRVRVVSLLAVALPVAYLALNKNQLTPVVLLAVPLLLWRSVGRRALLGRLPGLLLCGALALGASSYLADTGPGFTSGNTWDLWFGAVLADSPTPAADLRELGMDPALASYAGSNAWAGAGWVDPAFLAVQDNMTRSRVLGFLAHHPGRLVELGRRAVTASTVTRVPYLSNVHDDHATQVVLTARPDPVGRVLAALRPVAWPLLPLGWAAAALAGLLLMRRRSPWGAALYVTGGGAALLCAAALGDGYYELEKHELYAGFLTGLLLALLAAGVLQRLLAVPGGRRQRGRHEAPPPARRRELSGAFARA